MKEYFVSTTKEHAIVLDDDGDRLTSFDIAFNYIKNSLSPTVCEYSSPFFDNAKGYFIKDNIRVNLVCSNWFGTEIRIPENSLSTEEFWKVRKWADEIYNEIHKK